MTGIIKKNTTMLWLLAAGAQAAELKETQINLEKAKLAISDQHYQEAAELLKPVVAVEPDNAEALRYLGLAQIGLSDFKAAEQSLARALKKDPSLLGARLDHAWAAIELKQPDPALADLEAVLAKEPDLPRVPGVLAILGTWMGASLRPVRSPARAARCTTTVSCVRTSATTFPSRMSPSTRRNRGWRRRDATFASLTARG